MKLSFSHIKVKYLWLYIVTGVFLVLFILNITEFVNAPVSKANEIEQLLKSEKKAHRQALEILKENNPDLPADLLQRQQNIRDLWDTFAVPDSMELDFYTHGAGMAMVDLENLKSIDKPNSRQLYIGLQILALCRTMADLPEWQKADDGNSYVSEIYKTSDMYCEGSNFDETEINNLAENYMLELSKHNDLEFYLGAFYPIPYPDNINPSFFPEKIKELSQHIKDPQELLLLLPRITNNSNNPDAELNSEQKIIIASSLIAACSSYIDCDYSKPDEIQELCIIFSISLCNQNPTYEQLAQEIAGDTDINQLYQQAENIVIKIKNNDQVSIFSVFSTSP